MSACHLHPAKAALGGCTSCGRFVCEICMNKVEGKIVCDTCVRLSSHSSQALQTSAAPPSRSSGPLTHRGSHPAHRNTGSANITPQYIIDQAVTTTSSATQSLSQTSFTVLNVLATLVTLGMVNSFGIVFFLPATMVLWYVWFQRRKKGHHQTKEAVIVQEISQLAMMNQGEVSLGQLAAQGRYTIDDYEEEVHKLTSRGLIRQVLDEEQGTIKYYMQ